MKKNIIELAKRAGISAQAGLKFMAYDADANGVRVNYDKTLNDMNIARDAAMATAPTVGIPAAALTYIDPTVTTILFGKMAATELFSEVRKGDWTDKYMEFPVVEMVGNVSPYDDNSDAGSSDMNQEYPVRQNYSFQTMIKYGQREMETGARAGLQVASGKQKSAAFVIQNAHNQFYLYGVKGKQIWGILNDPNLPVSETPISVDSASTWEAKAGKRPDSIANLIFNDISKLVSSLIGRNAGNVDANTPMRLAIGSKRFGYLTMPNTFGKTALQLIKENYVNMEVIQLPQLDTAEGSKLYLCVPELAGEATAENAFAEKMRFFEPIRQSSSYTQKAIGSTWGGVVKRPTLVATMTGI